MLNLFRTNQLIVNIFLLFYAGGLHLSALIWPDNSWEAPTYGIFTDWVYQLIGSTGILAEITSTLLVFAQAVLLNVFFANNRITRDYTLFPGLFYILMASAIPEFLHLSPLLLANTFYLFAYRELFFIYRRPLAAGPIFNSGFWISIASLFYFSFILFLFWGFVALNIMRAFRLKERFMIVIGLLVPYLLTSVYFFFIDQWDVWIQRQFLNNYSWLDFQKTIVDLFSIKLIFMGLLVLILLLSYNSFSSRKTIDVQKKISLMYWGLFFGGFTLFFQKGLTFDHAAIVTVPTGMLLSIIFTQLSNRWAESLHFLLVTLILFFQYHKYFLPFSL